jgi:hypothetical protein
MCSRARHHDTSTRKSEAVSLMIFQSRQCSIASFPVCCTYTVQLFVVVSKQSIQLDASVLTQYDSVHGTGRSMPDVKLISKELALGPSVFKHPSLLSFQADWVF